MGRFPPGIPGDPGAIVLLSCYELGHEPLGALVPAGVFERAGIPCRVMDVAVDEFDLRAASEARLVAISTPMHTALRLGMRVAARVREANPAAHVCFHGLYAGLHAPHLLPALADTCLDAECEADLVDLARAILARPDRPAREVRLQRVPRPPARSRERSMDLTPLRPARPPNHRYVRLAVAGELRDVGYVAATRGCKHLCRHCPIPAVYQGSFYALPLERVLQDLDAVVARGARHITFADADFLNGPTHALRVARELRRRHPGLTFDYTAKIENLLRHDDVVAELQDLGALFVVSAVESFHDEVLRRLHKGHTAEDALAVIRRFRDRSLALRPSLVPFTPWETRASLLSLFRTVAEEGLVDAIDPVQYSIRLLVPEGSLLARDPSLAGLLGAFDPARLSYAWAHPDPGMDELQPVLAAIAAGHSPTKGGVAAAFAAMFDAVAPGGALPEVAHRRGPTPRLTEDWFC